jgi:hypothetical protein
MHTIIEVRPHGAWWKVFEAPEIEPIFPNLYEALRYAEERTKSGSGEIRVLNSNGAVEKVIRF